MRKVLSEVSITDMILANTMIPKSESMISLPEALANTIERLNWSESKLLNNALCRSHAQNLSCDPRSARGSNQMPCKSETNNRSPRMRGNQQQPELWMSCADNSAITADSRHSSNGTHSQDTRSPSPFTRRFRKSRIIKKVDMSTLLARTEPIPKWITIKLMDIHSPIPGRRVSPKTLKQESTPQMPSRLPVERSEFAAKHNLMSLAELAKVMCDESNKVVVDGMFQPGDGTWSLASNANPHHNLPIADAARVNALRLGNYCTWKSHHAEHAPER